ncbi:hypothetical protein DICVIV_12086 [Dictyocaulus viviparus]|uniref:Uncharacterized protein n=1 Tax=Dictyocaulus viviparus TaxID=29172 RepID=A0A0D8XHX2_DICVI|nr:hypothetical protein DICVIV_12086 [Dictyocaulus viviparus]
MNSATENLMSYFNTQKLNGNNTNNRIKKGTISRTKDIAPLRKKEKEEKLNVTSNKNSAKSQKSLKTQLSNGNKKKKRERRLSIVSTSSEGTKKSFKIVIRRDIPSEGESSVKTEDTSSSTSIKMEDKSSLTSIKMEDTSSSTSMESSSQHIDNGGSIPASSLMEDVTSVDQQDSLRGVQKEAVARCVYPRRMSTFLKFLKAISDDSIVYVSMAQNVAHLEGVKKMESTQHSKLPDESFVSANEEIEDNDDVVIVHESIRKKARKPFWCNLTIGESSLVIKLATMLKMNLIDIDESNWFEVLYRKAQLFEKHLDVQLKMYHEKKLELLSALNTTAQALLSTYPRMPSNDSNMRVGTSNDEHDRQQFMEISDDSQINGCNGRRGHNLFHNPTSQLGILTAHENSLNKIIDTMKSQQEDIPRDPIPSSAIPTRQNVLNVSGNSQRPYKKKQLIYGPKGPLQNKLTSPLDLTAVVPFQMPMSLTMRKRPQDTRVIAKRISHFSKPRYIFKNGVCYERKYGIASTDRHVGPLDHR